MTFFDPAAFDPSTGTWGGGGEGAAIQQTYNTPYTDPYPNITGAVTNALGQGGDLDSLLSLLLSGGNGGGGGGAPDYRSALAQLDAQQRETDIRGTMRANDYTNTNTALDIQGRGLGLQGTGLDYQLQRAQENAAAQSSNLTSQAGFQTGMLGARADEAIYQLKSDLTARGAFNSEARTHGVGFIEQMLGMETGSINSQLQSALDSVSRNLGYQTQDVGLGRQQLGLEREELDLARLANRQQNEYTPTMYGTGGRQEDSSYQLINALREIYNNPQ